MLAFIIHRLTIATFMAHMTVGCSWHNHCLFAETYRQHCHHDDFLVIRNDQSACKGVGHANEAHSHQEAEPRWAEDGDPIHWIARLNSPTVEFEIDVPMDHESFDREPADHSHDCGESECTFLRSAPRTSFDSEHTRLQLMFHDVWTYLNVDHGMVDWSRRNHRNFSARRACLRCAVDQSWQL